MANNQIYNTFAALGAHYGDVYIVNENCLEILEEILRNLIVEDCTLRTYRRAIGFGQNIRKDLIPLLINVKNNTRIENATKIIDATVKILLNLTIPVECLLSLERESQTEIGRHTIFELNRLLITSKEAFIDSRSTKAVVDHIKYVVDKDSTLNVEQCDSINNCLLLLRNILHIPESISSCPLAHSSMQNQIVWNLFIHSIDKIMIYLLSSPQKMYWGVTMVQLIALLYKDQHVGTLQKLLSLWFEASLSESSEDNESNTSPQNQGSGESSPTITSDPTSDSSDNGGSNKANDKSKSKEAEVNDVCNRAAEVVRAVQNRSKALTGIKRGQSTETETSINSGGSQSTDSGILSKTDSLRSSNREKLDQTAPKSDGVLKGSQKYNCKSSQSEFSDCGYSTQVENRGESISTSSNDDDQPHQKPVHQKPFQKTRYNSSKANRSASILEKKELRRKKLVKRGRTNIINMKGLMHHSPSDEDITNVLKEFTVDFLLKAYGTLVHDLHSQLLTNMQLPIDTSHFFWLVTYFLKFAAQLELDLELINSVLTYDIISYLVFQGVWLYEELEIGCRLANFDLKPSLRRLHLVVTAIREFLQALETYQKITHLSETDHNYLIKLQEQIGEIEELNNLFLLLLRQYNSNVQSKQYLQDVIVTNHSYLLLLDKISKMGNLKLDIMEHLKEFTTAEIMRQYGILLEDFPENGEFVNNCIFTMMHHAAGDLGNISTLFQPNILKTFSLIWETDYELCDDWSDLIEYVIHRFINISKTNQQSYSTLTTTTPVVENISTLAIPSQKSMESDVSFHFRQFREEAVSHPVESVECTEDGLTLNNFNTNCRSLPSVANQDGLVDEVEYLKGNLVAENKQKLIAWLQKALIEACYAKLIVTNSEMSKGKTSLVQPVAYYYTLLNMPIPLVPWTSEQFNVIQHQPFVLLLHKLGFILPGDVGKVFVRIPNFWSADYLFSVAKQLGPIDIDNLEVNLHLILGAGKTLTSLEPNVSQVNFNNPNNFLAVTSKQTPSMIRYTPMPNSTEWFSTVLRSKVTPVMNSALNITTANQLLVSVPKMEMVICNETPAAASTFALSEACKDESRIPADMDYFALHDGDEGDHNSESTSATSDLTRMCVSDEDEKAPMLNQKD